MTFQSLHGYFFLNPPFVTKFCVYLPKMSMRMIDYLLSNLWALWACISVACLMLELTSGDCFLICIAIGSAATALVAALGGGIYVQLIVASIVSLFCLFAIRPKLLKKLHEGEDKRVSNADAMLNKEGVVTQDIPEHGFGRVATGGDDWKAKSADGQPLCKGQRVKITAIESIIITVTKI